MCMKINNFKEETTNEFRDIQWLHGGKKDER